MRDKAFHVEGVSLSFGEIRVLSDLCLDVNRGEFLAVVGPSGCGKTTLLRVLSGALSVSCGKVNRSGHSRMVYQQDGLLPWLTVKRNIALGLRHINSEAERDSHLKEMLKVIGLEAFDKHYPHQLSGGMRQRVELARALVGENEILLMDEPFSSLDYLTRLRMRHDLARMLMERPRTVVFVTHQIEEAACLADRILVLSERPSRILSEVRLGLPRPRDPTHASVVDATRHVLNELGFRNRASSVVAADDFAIRALREPII